MVIGVDGFLTGTPTQTGFYNFGVCVVDSIAASSCGTTTVQVVDEEEESAPASDVSVEYFSLRVIGVGIRGSVYTAIGDPGGEYRTVSFVRGSVTSSPEGIQCGDVCSAKFPNGTSVSLTATVDDEYGSEFAGWSGDCSGKGSCTLVMDSDKEVVAAFDPKVSVTVSATCTPNPEISGGDVKATGSAGGAVGSTLSVVGAGISLECTSWTEEDGFCIRMPGQPSMTSWTKGPSYTPFSESTVKASVFITLNNDNAWPFSIDEAKMEAVAKC